MKNILLTLLILSQYLSFSQSFERFEKDIDFDNVYDTIYVDYDKATIVCKLSSLDFKKTESLPIESLTEQSGVSSSKNGFKYNNIWMRAGYSSQFKYNKKTKKIELIGMSRYEFGNAANDGSGESSVNLLTDDYIGNWNYYDHETDELKKIPSIKTKMYLSTVSLNQFNEKTYSNYSEQCAKLFHRFKEIEINSLNNNSLIEGDTEMITYTEFKPKKIIDFQFINFNIGGAYQLDAFKIISGNYEPINGKISKPDSEKDWGDRLMLLNNKNEILFKSFGVGDAYSFEPHFYKNNKTNKIIIICQLAYEYCFGGEAFIYENGKVSTIGLLDVDSDNEEKCLIDIIEIQEIADEIIFSFNSENILLEPGSESILVKSKGVTYNYINNKLTLKR